MALVIDVSWYWANTLKVQRAADSAALAGVVWLPDKPDCTTGACFVARREAAKNGYTNGSGGVTISAVPDANNDRRLNVTVSAPVSTFFMRIIGISTITATENAHAEYVLPVPMGSPENYYGVFGAVRNATFSTTADTGFDPPTIVATGGTWAGTSNVLNKTVGNLVYSTSTTANLSVQLWSTFNWTNGTTPAIPSGATITGIQAQLTGALQGSGSPNTNCTIGVTLSWNAGTSWSSTLTSAGLTTTDTQLPIIGSSSSTSLWGPHTWVQGDFSNPNFRVRLTWNRGSCASTRTAGVDVLTLRATYGTVTTTSNNLQGPNTPCSARTTGAPSDCYQPDGAVLNPRGFWGAMNTKGIQASDGDAFQSDKDYGGTTTAPDCSTVTGLRNCYDPSNYYNYAIDLPAGTSGVYVYIFDPVFCDENYQSGVGDGQSSGSLDASNPPSSWYELWDTNNTLYSVADDTLVLTTGPKFLDMKYSDTSMGGAGPSGSLECKQTNTAYGDSRDYHDNWYLLNPGNPLSGGTTGKIYRLHTTNSTPPGQTDPLVADQMQVKTEQNFALYASATSGTPTIYGLGAMEMYTPLNAGTSEFYLAKIPDSDAGKTLELNLWDPGDTSGTATLYVEQPTSTAGTWAPINFAYKVSSPAGGCSPASSSGTNVGSVVTGTFNACWLTIDVVIPTGYTAPQDGWWKIKYTMTSTSTDTTTWTAQIKGNPVHLVLP